MGSTFTIGLNKLYAKLSVFNKATKPDASSKTTSVRHLPTEGMTLTIEYASARRLIGFVKGLTFVHQVPT